MLLIEDEHERHLVDCVILNQVRVSLSNHFLSLVNTNDLESMSQVALWDLLDVEHIIAVEDGLKVLLLEELVLELVELLVVWVLNLVVLLLDCLEHL